MSDHHPESNNMSNILESVSSDTLYLFIGVFLAILLQISTSLLTELVASKREKRSADRLSRNEYFAFKADVDTILERNQRSTEDCLLSYSKIWSGLSASTKAQYGENIKEIDCIFWEFIYIREDKNTNNVDYNNNKINKFEKIKL